MDKLVFLTQQIMLLLPLFTFPFDCIARFVLYAYFASGSVKSRVVYLAKAIKAYQSYKTLLLATSIALLRSNHDPLWL